MLIQNFASWKDQANINWYSPNRHQNILDLIEVVGKIKVDKIYSYYVDNNTVYSSCGDFDNWIIGQINRQFAFEKENNKSNKTITIIELTKNSKWKLW